jgi:hypothetical protein
VAGTSSLAKLLFLIVTALVGGSAPGALLHPIGETAMVGPAGHRAFDQGPAGSWEATGHIAETDGPGTGVHHRTLTGRYWRFVTRCQGSRCRTLFLRTTPLGVQRAVLHRHRGYFTATFGPSPQPCEDVPGMPGNYTAHFRIRWTKDGTLFAAERGHYGGRCSEGWTRAHWTATPAPATDGSSEASPQVL